MTVRSRLVTQSTYTRNNSLFQASPDPINTMVTQASLRQFICNEISLLSRRLVVELWGLREVCSFSKGSVPEEWILISQS